MDPTNGRRTAKGEEEQPRNAPKRARNPPNSNGRGKEGKLIRKERKGLYKPFLNLKKNERIFLFLFSQKRKGKEGGLLLTFFLFPFFLFFFLFFFFYYPFFLRFFRFFVLSLFLFSFFKGGRKGKERGIHPQEGLGV